MELNLVKIRHYYTMGFMQMELMINYVLKTLVMWDVLVVNP